MFLAEKTALNAETTAPEDDKTVPEDDKTAPDDTEDTYIDSEADVPATVFGNLLYLIQVSFFLYLFCITFLLSV